MQHSFEQSHEQAQTPNVVTNKNSGQKLSFI